MSISRHSLMVASVAIATLSHPDQAFTQEKLPGCTPWQRNNSALMNNQVVTVSGGQCGGQVTVYLNMVGKAQFFNDDGVPKAGVRIYKDATSLPIDNPNLPNDGPAKENLCIGQPRWFDQKFNDFNVECSVIFQVAIGETRSFLMNYMTERVSDNPLPRLYTKASYTPAQTDTQATTSRER